MACRKMNEYVAYARNTESRCNKSIMFKDAIMKSRETLRNIEILGKQNSLFPKGTVIKWFVI